LSFPQSPNLTSNLTDFSPSITGKPSSFLTILKPCFLKPLQRLFVYEFPEPTSFGRLKGLALRLLHKNKLKIKYPKIFFILLYLYY